MLWLQIWGSIHCRKWKQVLRKSSSNVEMEFPRVSVLISKKKKRPPISRRQRVEASDSLQRHKVLSWLPTTLLKKTWIFLVGSLEIQVFFQEGGSKTGRQMFVRVRGKSKKTMHVCYTPSHFCKSCSLELCVTMAMIICFSLYSRLPSLKEAETPGKTG